MAERAKRRHGLWWWADRFRKSSAFVEMTLAEQGAYRNLLDYQRLNGDRIPNDERVLSKACGDPLEWPVVRDKVLRWFEVSPDGAFLFNRTAVEINAETDRLSAAAAVGGKARAEAAQRDGGKFTSGSPAALPAAEPAETQPPLSVVRSPLSVSVAGTESGNTTADEPAFGVMLDEAACPACRFRGALRNAKSGGGYFCGTRLHGCGQNFDIEEPSILAQLTPRAREAIQRRADLMRGPRTAPAPSPAEAVANEPAWDNVPALVDAFVAWVGENPEAATTNGRGGMYGVAFSAWAKGKGLPVDVAAAVSRDGQARLRKRAS